MIFTKIKDINLLILITINIIFASFYLLNFDLKSIFLFSVSIYLIISFIFFFIYRNNVVNFFIIVNLIYIILGHVTLDYFYMYREINSSAYRQTIVNDYISINILNFLFIISSKFTIDKENKFQKNVNINNQYYYICYLLIILGYCIYVYFLSNFDFFEFYKMNRVQRAMKISEYLKSNINLPYSYLFYVSFALCSNLFFRKIISLKKYVIFIIFLMPYAISILIEGDRSVILYFVLPSMFIFYFYNNTKIYKNFTPILMLLSIFIILGLYRGPMAEYLKTNSTDYFDLRTNQIIENPIGLIPAEFSSVTWAKIKSLEYKVNYSDSFSTFFISFIPNDIIKKISASKTLSNEISLRKHNRSQFESPGFNYYLEWYYSLKEFGVILVTIFVFIILNTYNRLLILTNNPLSQSILFCFIVHLITLVRSNIQGVMNSIFLFMLVFSICIFFLYTKRVIGEIMQVKERGNKN